MQKLVLDNHRNEWYYSYTEHTFELQKGQDNFATVTCGTTT